jgi:hypothetical protein
MTPADTTAVPVEARKRFFRALSGRRGLFLLGGLVCVLVVLNEIGGRLVPVFLNSLIRERMGATLEVDDNRSSLFLGKVEFRNARLVNPPGFNERIFLKINRAKVSFNPFLLLVGRWDFPEVIFDIGELTLAGKTPKHNNLGAFHDTLSASKKKRRDATAGKSRSRENFHVGKLVLNIDRFRIVAETDAAHTRTLLDLSNGILAETITDITQDNFKVKVLDFVERHLNARSRAATAAGLPARLGTEARHLLDAAASAAGDSLIHAGETATHLLEGVLDTLAVPGKPAP